MQQYLSIKDAYPDTILFYRMGDFYEMFFEDAEVASRALEITLTSRNKKDKTPIPMCGVPYRAARGYIARLLQQGHKVAICDQVEDPALAKGLVKRDVVRVITPGMIVENELLDEKSDNYVLALVRENDLFGLSYLDISTGKFRVTESTDLHGIVDEAMRLAPSELILPEDSREGDLTTQVTEALPEKAVTFLDSRAFEYGRGRERLLEQFKTVSLEGFGCENLRTGTRAAGALIYYVRETQKQKIEHISRIETYSLESYLLIDELSCRNLELIRNLRTGSRNGTLLGVLDGTVTAMGGRLLKRWLRYPLTDRGGIESRLEAIEESRSNPALRKSIREGLRSVYDLERLASKVSMGHCNARDLVALKQSLEALPEVMSYLAEFDAALFQFQGSLDQLGDLSDLIDRAIREDAPPTINEGGIIQTGFNSRLDDLIAISRDGKGWLAKLETREREAAGVNSLKVRYNKVFGYYIEVPKTHSDAMPDRYIRKQTLVNAERYFTEELKSFESRVLSAEDERATLEYEIFNEIRGEVVENNARIQSVADFLAVIDCLHNLADIAEQNDYTRPEINSDDSLSIEEGRHPVVEKMITGERFVPNSVKMDNCDNQVLIITGPNMAGKSTVLRQVALLVIMAQMGSFVPAARASVGIADMIFTRVGALDNLSQGQSTFMVEMQETANILNNATSRSLVIMDEIGRGTSTFDGLSIAWAVAEYLHELRSTGVRTLFATHYHELTELAQALPRVRNYNIAVREWNDQIIFLRKLVEGGTNRSYGIQVARLAGIPGQVITRAKKILARIDNGGTGTGGSLLVPDEKIDRKAGQEQLELFQSPEKVIMSKLEKLDIAKMTPLDALNHLDELKRKLEEGSD